jgi:hypothetical protein
MPSYKIHARHVGAVLVVTAIGSMGLERLLQARAHADGSWTKRTVAQVNDLRAGACSLSAYEWECATRAGLRWSFSLARPIAWVVRAEERDFYQDMVLELASHGIVRAVFTDLEAALAWAGARRESLFAPPARRLRS